MKQLIVLAVLLLTFLLPVSVFADDGEGQNIDVTVNVIPKKTTGSVSYYYSTGGNTSITCEPARILTTFVTGITTSSAIVNWHTDYKCKSRVWFAEYEYYDNMQYTEWQYNDIFYLVLLENLKSDCKYAYQVVVEDDCGIRRTEILSFRTEKAILRYTSTEDDVIPDKTKNNVPEPDYTIPDEPEAESNQYINWGLICIIAGIIALIVLLSFVAYKVIRKKPVP